MIDLERISVSYGDTTVMHDLSLDVRESEFFTLLGPSGCGKTTLLRTISGFVTPSSGSVHISGRDVTALAPEDRGIGVVFQNYALFPHLTVFENVAFGLRVARTNRAEIASRVQDALDRIGVAEHAAKKPAELSGGQQQRVAIARALILGARVLLLDEPLSNLDAKLREAMRDEIRDIQQRMGLTAVYVTHDQHEALAISDRVAVMESGAVRQIGTPRELYASPTSAFVCSFIGDTSCLPPHPAFQPNGRAVRAFVRPEHVHLGVRDGDGWINLEPTLERMVYQGARTRLVLRAGDTRLTAEAPSDQPEHVNGDTVPVSIRLADVHLYPEAQP
ncbi:ABC transporter ATP-binding protein [Pseudoruegeria sp. HB172150]|uniref:ABC transporter ATP-binding protein n=1 Tax=Pseudoruegeria sp. HB172150 TaxID=2721164 RepID=UPI0015565AC0|nr:ABC transporter ATP-binding protein [Pseudoruegeria sp. HB172150]